MDLQDSSYPPPSCVCVCPWVCVGVLCVSVYVPVCAHIYTCDQGSKRERKQPLSHHTDSLMIAITLVTVFTELEFLLLNTLKIQVL